MKPTLFLLLMSTVFTDAQSSTEANYDEAKVGSFTLPSALTMADSTAVTTAEQWSTKRRTEVLGLFRDHMYGRTPKIDEPMKAEVIAVKDDALGGIAVRKFIRLTLPSKPQWQGIDVALYVPKGLGKPAPVFVGLSFGGNHAVSKEADVPLNPRWMRPSKAGRKGSQATEADRGTEASRWPLEMIIKRGYAVATAYYGDLEPDHVDGWKDGIRAAISPDGANTQWQANDWGAIGAWAWGQSKMLDYLLTDKDVDARHAAIIGHSRLGKGALWAGVQDERFGIVISNNSGEGGAALSRRYFGETTKRITTSFPHWFARRYTDYADAPNDKPIDQHQLIALVAPRAVYIASAVEDRWADPHGEFLAGKEASPVWALFGKVGVGVDA